MLEHDKHDEPERPRAGFFLYVMPAVLYVGAVFYGGSMATAAMPEMTLISADKFLHAIAFGGMQLVLLRAIRFELPALALEKQNVISLVLASGVGALLEFYQMALPHRSAELLDWIADTLGALLVAAVVHALARRKRGT